MIEAITVYRCTKCSRTFEQKVEECTECRNKIQNDTIIGPFRIIKRLDLIKKFRVECLLCGFEKEIFQSNVRRQSSCGCRPRHIELHNITAREVRYHCRRCGDNRVEELPVFTWCCTEDFEYES